MMLEGCVARRRAAALSVVLGWVLLAVFRAAAADEGPVDAERPPTAARGDVAVDAVASRGASLPDGAGWTAIGPDFDDLDLGPGDPKAQHHIINAWGDAAYDTRRDRMIFFGGGHGDSPMNPVVAFRFSDLRWEVLLPFISVPPGYPDATCTEMRAYTVTLPDGSAQRVPSARHTYGNTAYIPAADGRERDYFFLHGGSQTCGSGGFGRDTWLFDLAERRWIEVGDDLPDNPGRSILRCAYDPIDDRVYCADKGSGWVSLRSFDPDSRTWARHSSSREAVPRERESSAIIVTDRTSRFYHHHITVGGKDDNDVLAWNLDTFALSRHRLTGDLGILTQARPGLTFDARRRVYVAWAQGLADRIFEIDFETLTVTERPVPGGPASEHVTGTYGRFRYVESRDALAALPNGRGPMWLLRLSR